MAEVAVTVIMPVYNSERYVEQAVRSILSQEFDSFELLLIDDGSSDGSGAICDDLAAGDSRVRVVHKKNEGMCSARNLGIQLAQGEYLGFADNDDLMLPGLLRDNYALAKEHDADCVRFGRRCVTTNECGDIIQTSELVPKQLEVLNGDELFERYEQLMFTEAVWTGLFRKSCIVANGITFDERLRHGSEDRLFVTHVFEHARTIVLNPGIYYVWQRRVGHSASVSLGDNKFLGWLLATSAEHHLMVAHDVDKTNPAFFGKRMLTNLMEAEHDVANTRSNDGWRDMGNLVARLGALYRPYAKELKQVPLGAVSKVILTSALKGRSLPSYLYVRYARAETKRQVERQQRTA